LFLFLLPLLPSFLKPILTVSTKMAAGGLTRVLSDPFSCRGSRG
jgi:hypothetical protein